MSQVWVTGLKQFQYAVIDSYMGVIEFKVVSKEVFFLIVTQRPARVNQVISMKIALLFLALTLVVAGAGTGYYYMTLNKGKSTPASVAKDKTVSIEKKVPPKQIIILPLGKNTPASFSNDIYQKIKAIIPSTTLGATTAMPAFAYNASRGRYRADSLLGWMSKMAKPNQVYLGVTTVDISTTLRGVQDWGVMGLGLRPGNACIASSFRLKHDKYNFWKVAIHELGHTAGLPHCPEPTCLMRDAEGGNPLKHEKAFCKNCKTLLVQKGWSL